MRRIGKKVCEGKILDGDELTIDTTGNGGPYVEGWEIFNELVGKQVRITVEALTPIVGDELNSGVRENFDSMIGRLDRLLSEFLGAAKSGKLDEADQQTIKHHADDLIGVGQAALKAVKP